MDCLCKGLLQSNNPPAVQFLFGKSLQANVEHMGTFIKNHEGTQSIGGVAKHDFLYQFITDYCSKLI